MTRAIGTSITISVGADEKLVASLTTEHGDPGAGWSVELPLGHEADAIRRILRARASQRSVISTDSAPTQWNVDQWSAIAEHVKTHGLTESRPVKSDLFNLLDECAT